MKYSPKFIHLLYMLFYISFHVKGLLSIVFVVSYFNLVFAKPHYQGMQSPRSRAFSQHSQGQDFQPFPVDATEQEENISKTSVDCIARNTHPCVKTVVRGPSEGHKHGGRDVTKTSVAEFSY